jgi:phosphoglycerate dehydrogenase-like enzyme
LPKITLADKVYLNARAINILKQSGALEYAKTSNEEGFMAEVADSDVIVVEIRSITERVIGAAKRLRGIVVFGVGYDCVDVKAASQRSIFVANCRSANAEAVAEMAFFKMLDLARKGSRAHRMVADGRWNVTASGANPDWLMGSELLGKKIGIIGFGEIGRRVARIARGFRMDILVSDPLVDDRIVRQSGAVPVDLVELLKETDFITLHVPLIDETKELIGEKELKLVKKSAIIINTSRGGVVNERALIEASRGKGIAGVGLDVYAKEPLPTDSEILALQNTSLSPHIAGNTKEANDACAEEVAINVQMILNGKIPRNIVNLNEVVATTKRAYITHPRASKYAR